MSGRTPLEQLQNLVPDLFSQVGDVYRLVDNYRVQVQLPTGDLFLANTGGETYAINDRVYIEGTDIKGKVPSLPSTTQDLVI